MAGERFRQVLCVLTMLLQSRIHTLDLTCGKTFSETLRIADGSVANISHAVNITEDSPSAIAFQVTYTVCENNSLTSRCTFIWDSAFKRVKVKFPNKTGGAVCWNESHRLNSSVSSVLLHVSQQVSRSLSLMELSHQEKVLKTFRLDMLCCEDGHYNVSNNCQNTCGGGCSDTCNKTDGTCQCRPGWEPPLCQRCAVGLWRDNCSLPCGAGCENRTCDAVNGTCSCMNGWAAPRCEARSCTADTNSDCGCANTVGPVAGAIVGSISGCVIGLLLGILLMRFRLSQQLDTQTPAAGFSAPMETGWNSSPAEESSPARPVSSDYQNAAAVYITSNVYDSLKPSPDDNVYNKLK